MTMANLRERRQLTTFIILSYRHPLTGDDVDRDDAPESAGAHLNTVQVD